MRWKSLYLRVHESPKRNLLNVSRAIKHDFKLAVVHALRAMTFGFIGKLDFYKANVFRFAEPDFHISPTF